MTEFILRALATIVVVEIFATVAFIVWPGGMFEMTALERWIDFHRVMGCILAAFLFLGLFVICAVYAITGEINP